MLSCKEVADRASALIDGELSAWDALQMRLHLAMCKGCGAFIEQIRISDRPAAQVTESSGLEESQQREVVDGRYAEVLSILRNEQSCR
jgi:anti-sigma factor RsiW